MSTVRITTALVVLVILMGALARSASADLHQGRGTNVLVIDRYSLGEVDNGVQLTESLVGLISALKHNETIALITTDDPPKMLGPVELDGPEYGEFLVEMKALLATPPPLGPLKVDRAMAAAYDFLNTGYSAAGSPIYFIAGGANDSRVSEPSSRLHIIDGLLKKDGWPIISLSLDTTGGQLGEVLATLSRDSGGRVIPFRVPEGLRDVTNTMLGSQAQGSLTSLAETEMATGDVLASTLDIVPGTEVANIIFFKDDPRGSLRLSNPSGLEASSGDRALSSVTETPHAVIWTLVDPAPGEWRVDVRGVDGAVSAWHAESNKFTVELLSYESLPLDQTTSLVAYVDDEGDPVLLEGVTVLAQVTGPQGKTQVRELKDDGRLGDVEAGDGFYSSTLAPFAEEGTYRLDLELRWPDLDYAIETQKEIYARPFPTIAMTRGLTDDLKEGRRSLIASVEVLVDGHPFAIPTDQLTADVSVESGDPGTIDIVPRRMVSPTEAWEYDVYFTPAEENLHTLILGLDMEYDGRPYINSSLVELSSLPSEGAIRFGEDGIPWIVPIAPLLIALVVLLVLVAYAFTRTRPYGFLYNDANEMVVDFSTMRPRNLLGYLTKNRVPGRQLSLRGLEGVSFEFSRDGVDMRATEAPSSIRINNQPLVDHMPVRDRSWIGAQGRLYSFFMSKLTMDPDPGLADD